MAKIFRGLTKRDTKLSSSNQKNNSTPPATPPLNSSSEGLSTIQTSYSIHLSELQFLDSIGEGGYGVVRRARWNETMVAVKALSKASTTEAEIVKEIKILTQLHHPNVVQLYGFSLEPHQYLLVMELIKGGDLAKLIHSTTTIPISLSINLLTNIAIGMIYLHKRGIIHRDLKPGNILIANLEEGIVKVTDFGLSKLGTPSDLTKTPQYATPLYSAPEMANSDSYTEKVDVFSYAIISWELFARKLPFEGSKWANEVVKKIAKGERPSPIPDSFPKELRKLVLEKGWHTDPKKRPSFQQVYEELTKVKPKILSREDSATAFGSGLVGSGSQVFEVSPKKSGITTATSTTSMMTTNGNLQLSGESPTNSSTASIGSPALARGNSSQILIQNNNNNNNNNNSNNSYNRRSNHTSQHELFMAFFKKPSGSKYEWKDLSIHAHAILLARPEKFILLKYLYDKGKFVDMLDWFSPLVPESTLDLYEGQSSFSSVDSLDKDPESGTEEGYSFSDIVDIIGKKWFHGFMSLMEANNVLEIHSPGSFLIRFSSARNFFSLDVRDESEIRHWRIEKVNKNLYKLNGNPYKSLNEIMYVHSEKPLALGMGGVSCRLLTAVERNA